MLHNTRAGLYLSRESESIVMPMVRNAISFKSYDLQRADNKQCSIRSRDFMKSHVWPFAPRMAVRAIALKSFVTMSDSANVDDTPRRAERSLRSIHPRTVNDRWKIIVPGASVAALLSCSVSDCNISSTFQTNVSFT